MSDLHWHKDIESFSTRNIRYKDFDLKSQYIPGSSGNELAIDIFLPKGHRGEPLPTIVRQTRYYRSFLFSPLVKMLGGNRRFNPMFQFVLYYVQRGYAFVCVDVRGTGASNMENPYPWSMGEIDDGASVCDWITAQSWSNGRIGSLGISYDGTCAEFLSITGHPSVKAVVPMFCLFDSYSDVIYPGGIPATWFTKTWATLNGALDRNRPGDYFGFPTALFMRGVTPVDTDTNRSKLAAALRERSNNYVIDKDLANLFYRDDEHPSYPGLALRDFSPCGYQDKLKSGAAVYSYSGWYDGAYQWSAIKRFKTLNRPQDRLIIGPWDHGGWNYCSTFTSPRKSRFNHLAEMENFFHSHLKDEEPLETPRISLYVLGEEIWRHFESWPNQSERKMWLHSGDQQRLIGSTPDETFEPVSMKHNPESTTGTRSRWNSLITPPPFKPVVYPGRQSATAKGLTFQSEPLEPITTILGDIQIDLNLAIDSTDGDLFLYLDGISPSGEWNYLTEGMLRLSHNKIIGDADHADADIHDHRRSACDPVEPNRPFQVTIKLFSSAFSLAKGWRLALTLCSADADHFAPLTNQFNNLTVHGGAITLPMMEAT